MGIRNFCCLCRPSEPVNDAALVAPDDAPTLRICFAVRIQESVGTRWECQEYRIRFPNMTMWRFAFCHLLDTPLVLELGSSSQEDEVNNNNNNNTEFDMTAAELDGECITETECDGEIGLPLGDDRAPNLKSHWSRSTTHSNSSLETIRASGKSHSRNDSSMRTPSPSNSVQTVRLISEQTDSTTQSQQALTSNQSQE